MNSPLDLIPAAAVASGVVALLAPLFTRARLAGAALAGCLLLLAADNTAAWLAGAWGWDSGLWAGLATALLPAAALAFSVTYARADARAALHRWRWGLATALAIPVFFLVVVPDALAALGTVERDGPTGERASLAMVALHAFVLVGALLALANLERTYRAAAGAARWRTKFILLGLGLLLAVRAYASTQEILLPGSAGLAAELNTAATLLGTLVIAVGLLRSARMQVEVYPSPMLVRNSLTIVLAGAYLFSVGLLAKLVGFLGGTAGFQLQMLVVLGALVGLATVLQSDRARQWGARFVSHHLRRPVHDYRAVWRATAESMSAGLDEVALCRRLVELVAPTVECLSVTVWLVDSRNEALSFAASSTLAAGAASAWAVPEPAELHELLRFCAHRPEPVVVDQAGGGLPTLLGRGAAGAFPGEPYAAWLPLVSQGEVLGLVGLGRRVRGTALSVEDLEILKCVADHAAASLRNAQLSRRLLQAKELGAFQTMATFFVHDLKNAAASLSLMLDNLPRHFDDPQFRADALRGIGRTVEHVNHLIGRLTQLRHELRLEPGEFDFNQLVQRVVSGCGAAGVETDLAPLPRLRFDPEQMTKVVTNLVRNAAEAVGTAGHVRVATRRQNDWAILSVQDDGCGMSPHFVSEQLFRPFQTTKPHGLGVGMFQSKMIVEAHHGRIAVQSAPGRGTTFQVLLPVEAACP